MIHKEKIYLTYSQAETVGKCVQTMLREKTELTAVPTIFIGYNGKEFVSSSDWEIQTPTGTCVLPFGVLPQYPSFIQVYAGMNYLSLFDEAAAIHPDAVFLGLRKERKAKVILPNGQEFIFSPGEAVKIPVTGKLAERFPLTDCRIRVEKSHNCMIYILQPDENTTYGSYNGQKVEEY